MPSKSKAQRNLMAAAAHNPAFAKKVGVPVNVAQEFNKADKGKKFKGGGMAKSDKKENSKMDKSQDKAMIKKAFKMHDKQEHKGEKTDLTKLKKGGIMKEKMCGGGYAKAKKMAMGGPTGMPSQSNAGGAMRGLDRAAAMSGRSFSNVGKPTGMKKGGTASTRADGIASKGKTKGKII